MKVDFLAPVKKQEVVVTGKRVKSGKTIFLTEAQMFDDKGKVLAHGTSKLMVTNNKQTINDVVKYISINELPHKFLKER